MAYRGGISEALERPPWRLEKETLQPFWENQAAILRVFQEDPDLVDNPYPEHENPNRKLFESRPKILRNAHLFPENPILIALDRLGLLSSCENAYDSITDWKTELEDLGLAANEKVSLAARAYALVDLTVYFAAVANIYLTNRPLLKNIAAVNTKIDAFGREDSTLAKAAVARFLRRTVPVQGIVLSQYVNNAETLLHLIQLDGAAVSRVSDGMQFEAECLQQLQDAGYEVQETPRSGDFGADILAERDGLTYAIQCKDISRPVGLRAVQEAAGARQHYRCDFAVVCSVGEFTQAALELASSNHVILCTASQLIARLQAS